MALNPHLRGQGATEYLVLLAVVLIIALVSIALLGFFPGLASDAKITQSNSYWQGDARPFKIVEHTIAGTGGTVSLVLQNVEATGSLTITKVNLALPNGTNKSWIGSMSFAPGEIKNLSGTIGGGSTSDGFGGMGGSIYDVSVNITYTTPNSLTATQFGSKPITGKYS